MRCWRDAPSTTFARRDGGRFQIGPGPLATFGQYVQDQEHANEAGGVLLGRHILDTSDIVVDEATGPLAGDRRHRSRFFRARRRHQSIIDRVWSESGGTCTYLGEWHTHPESEPTPSGVDWREWERKVWADQFSDSLFFVIVGIDYVCVWESCHCSAHLHALERVI